ncbi:hypothetical protein [Ensifer sp. LCM 4579]|uniref:hypothetical protein n=1 Tax=Ensifer sp. LCM 4579 TaxID=1848292 RepID=UPI0008D8EE5F|nr:hypothetical protein [Ensifer sp. LCM 4579]OHV85958.1 hypothetical protein LCM4579_00930 [Ensifer sp. LCM 4579]
MASIIQWPRDLLRPRECRPNIAPFTRTGGRALGGVKPAVRTDLGFWSIDLLDIAVYSSDQRRTWEAIAQHLSGSAGLVAVPAWSQDLQPYVSGVEEPVETVPHDDDTPFDDDSEYEQGAISIVTDGTTPLGATTIRLRIINAAANLVGVRFSYEHALYKTGPVIAVDGDIWTVPISPAVRVLIPAGADLEFDRPTCLCHLADDRGMDGGVDTIKLERRSVSFVEATDYWASLVS